MKTVGVIAELNPMHRGHAYLFETIRRETGADFIVLMMSGDFVQRGEPAIMDKFSRAEIALRNGADAVFELPVICATASAEYFARAGVSLLANAGIDEICFGAEDPAFPFERIAGILKEEPISFQNNLQASLSKGDSYPKARMEALLHFLMKRAAESGVTFEADDFRKALSSPNNILGIEYAKAAMEYKLPIHPIKRVGNGHNDFSEEGEYPSSSAIRDLLLKGEYPEAPFYRYLKDYTDLAGEARCFARANDMSDFLACPFLLYGNKDYTEYFDCTPDLSNRIQKHIHEYRDFTSFVSLLKTKNYTSARIQRVLLHIALGIKQTDLRAPKYLRLLGFKKDASGLLFSINGRAAENGCTMISKPAKAKKQLSEEQYALFEKDLSAADLYQYISQGDSLKADITRSPIVVS